MEDGNDFKISDLSLRVQGNIKTKLMGLNVQGTGYWESFLAEMQAILPQENWITADLRNQLLLQENSKAPEKLFDVWSQKFSYNVVNLIRILKNLGFDALVLECENEISRIKARRAENSNSGSIQPQMREPKKSEVKRKLFVSQDGSNHEVDVVITSMKQLRADLIKERDIKGGFTLQFLNPELKDWVVFQRIDQLSADIQKIKIIRMDIIEKVDIRDEIGHGSYSTIYRGIWMGKDVAIKVLTNLEFPEAYAREVNKYKNLRHPNVLPWYGVCLTPNYEKGIVTEIADGDLLTMLRKKEIKEGAFIGICKDVAYGMEYLAANKIVHRDLAARNLLVKIEGSKFVVKVADFGLSASTYSLKTNIELQRIKCAIRWTAPEALQNDHWTEKSDVWSFGIVIFEIYTGGERPYSDIAEDNEVRGKVINGITPGYPPKCSEVLKILMDSCWKKFPEERNDFESIRRVLQTVEIVTTIANSLHT